MTICLVVGFFLGIFVYSLTNPKQSSEQHWRAIRDYVAWQLNPARDSTPPESPDLHLAALVANHELDYIDLILPTVNPREGTKYWMKFCETHTNDIAYSFGNPEYTAFPVQGEIPLHLNIWFKPDRQPIVQQLVKELEALGTK